MARRSHSEMRKAATLSVSAKIQKIQQCYGKDMLINLKFRENRSIPENNTIFHAKETENLNIIKRILDKEYTRRQNY